VCVSDATAAAQNLPITYYYGSVDSVGGIGVPGSVDSLV
jgi:hypothetical protein